MRRSLLSTLAASAVLLSACGEVAGDGAAAPATSSSAVSSSAISTTTAPQPEGTGETPSASSAPPGTTTGSSNETPKGDAPGESTSCSDVVSGWNTEPESAPGYARADVVDVRTGAHGCYQRVVFDVNKPVEVGYRVGYVPVLRQEGSGRALDVAGGATLRVTIRASARTIAESGSDTLAAGRLPSGPVREIRFAGSFEGVSTFGIGVDAKRPFAVSVWQEGSVTHVIVDVATT